MRTLHGEPVAVGDIVFDVSATRGAGRVVNLGLGSIEVSFVSGPRLSFDGNGVQIGRGRATLFWHDPILTPPRKNNRSWQIQRKLFAALHELLEANEK